jgi:hypothetical protein
MFWRKKAKEGSDSKLTKEYLPLEKKVEAYKGIFEEKGFTYERCPVTRGMLENALSMAAKAERPRDVKRYCKRIIDASIEERIVEDTHLLNPWKTFEPLHTDEMITYFKKLIYDVNRQALKEKKYK